MTAELVPPASGRGRPWRVLAVKSVAGVAVLGCGLGWIDTHTVAAQRPAVCGKGQLRVEVPRPHIAGVAAFLDRPGPALRDVVAAERPDVALSTVVGANRGVVGSPMGVVPSTPGGVVCLTVPAQRVAPAAFALPAQVPASLSDVQLAGVAYGAGFRGGALATAVAVSLAESGGRVRARCYNTGHGCRSAPFAGQRSVDRGLWQINDRAHPDVSMAVADSPSGAARAAWQISGHGRNWRPWSSFNSGSYARFLPRARAAVKELGV
jgi:hypothetical protein